MKFQRTYNMTVQVDAQDLPVPLLPSNAVVIKYPLTATFDINRSTLGSANTGKFTVLNLKESTRRRIFHDRYDTLPASRRGIVMQAGYVGAGPLPMIFQGDITSAYSYRRGQDWVTEIEAFDGGSAILNGQASLSLPAGWDVRDVMKTLMGTLPGVGPGVIGKFSTNNSRGLTVVGNSWDRLQELGDGEDVFIDNGKVNAILKNEYIPSTLAPGIELITSETGLLNTPRRYKTHIDFDIMFEPRLVIGQLLQLQSLETINNGLYKVIGIRHNGTISGAIDGGAITSVSVWQGTERLKAAA